MRLSYVGSEQIPQNKKIEKNVKILPGNIKINNNLENKYYIIITGRWKREGGNFIFFLPAAETESALKAGEAARDCQVGQNVILGFNGNCQ